MKIGLSALLVIIGSVLIGQNPLWSEGVEAYQSENYSEAIDKWKSIENQGETSFDLLYNLGSAYYRVTDYYSAKLYFEKALLIDGGNKDARYNLKLVNQHFQDKRIYVPNWDITYLSHTINNSIPKLVWVVVSLAILIILLIWNFTRRNRVSKSLSIMLLLTSLVIYLFSVLIDSYAHNFHEVLVNKPRVEVRSSPSNSGNELFVLHKGFKLRKLEESGEWIKVQMTPEKQGWLPKSAVDKIDLH